MKQQEITIIKTLFNKSKINFKSIKNAFSNQVIQFSIKLEKSILDNPECRNKIIFGPIPSRRFGSVLIINNVLCKTCTYNCIYCQAGGANCCSTNRDSCFSPYQLYFFVKNKIEQLEKANIKVDYIGFIPNGEATLDVNLSKEIELLREFGYKIIVFTNSSLLWNDNVKENLMFADIVSLKIDTVDEQLWNEINRPHKRLRFEVILKGITDFSKQYDGKLFTETMLINNMNDSIEEVSQLCEFLKELKRDTSYFSVPIRPTVKDYALAPNCTVLEKIKEYTEQNLKNVKMLCCPNTPCFPMVGDTTEQLLGILSMHPMKEEEVLDLVSAKGWGIQQITELENKGLLLKKSYCGQNFYSHNN